MRNRFKRIFFILCSIVLSASSLFCCSTVANAALTTSDRNIDVFIGDSTTDGTACLVINMAIIPLFRN